MDEEQKKLAEELLSSSTPLPSFAKRLFFGQFDGQRILPFPGIDSMERQRLDDMLTRLRPFLRDKVDPDQIDRSAEIPREVILGLGEIGVLGVTIPKECSGQGMTQHSYCRVEEEISRRCGSTALFVNVHQSVGLKALTIYGTPEQQKRWLPSLASGEAVAAFSLTEPNAGSDANGVETRAIYDKDKRCYRITGIKQWTSNGSVADVLTVMARTEDNKITAFLVTPDMPGFRVRNASLEKVGMRGCKTANLAFDDMEVPEENILGEKGRGLQVALNVLNYGRTTFGAICLGAAKYCLERAVEHAKTRQQFKRPLSSFPLIKQKLARMAAYTYAMDATTYLTAGLLDGGQDDIMLESAILKVFASDALWETIYETMQVYGGRSFFTDEPFERMMRDARLNMIGEGANEVMYAFIGAVGMREVGLSLKDSVDAMKSPAGIPKALWSLTKGMLGHLRSPKIAVQHPSLQLPARLLSERIRRFGSRVPRLLAKYKEDIVEEQLVLDRMAKAVTSLFTMSAVLAKLDTELSLGTASSDDVESGLHYCRIARDNFDRQLVGLWSNHDKQLLALSDTLTGNG